MTRGVPGGSARVDPTVQHLVAFPQLLPLEFLEPAARRRNDLDDYLFDVVRDQKGYALTPAVMDAIIDRLLSIARARMPD